MSRSGMSRRDFLRIGGGAGAGLFFIGQIGGQRFKMPVGGRADPRRHARPNDRAEVRDADADPAGDAAGGHDHQPGGKPVDYYEISMRQFAQQILPAGLPATTVWGYGAVSGAEQAGVC